MENKEMHERNIGILEDRILGKTISEIADAHGITVSRVRQLLARSLRKVKGYEAIKRHNDELMSSLLEASGELAAYKYATRKKEAESKGEDLAEGEPINEANFSVRTFNCLHLAGYRTMEQVCNAKDHELFRIRNFGRKSLNEVKAVCAAYRLQQ